MIFGGLGRFTVFEVFQSKEQGGLTSASAIRSPETTQCGETRLACEGWVGKVRSSVNEP
jgi:hypothetical protein